jgi:hypothetical protein
MEDEVFGIAPLQFAGGRMAEHVRIAESDPNVAKIAPKLLSNKKNRSDDQI